MFRDIQGVDGYARDQVVILNGDLSAVDSGLTSKTQILLRDLLIVKMRQTGLNLDPNAWSDTLDDDSGINESESEYDSISGGSLKAITFPYRYPADALPTSSTPVWTADGTNGTESVSSGILTITSGSTDFNQRGYKRDSGNVPASPTKEVNVKFKVTGGGAANDVGGLRVFINDGTKIGIVVFDSGGRIKYIRQSDGFTVVLASGYSFSTDYAIARILFDSITGLQVYINGTLAGTVAYSTILSGTDNHISFDVYNGNASGEATALIDYFNYTLDNSVLSNATYIWDAQISSGTLTDAVVEAVESLGTGSITYYISRDGGTTFTACTLDTVTDISAQPSGTSVVLKAVISGNAELLAVAWGGQS